MLLPMLTLVVPDCQMKMMHASIIHYGSTAFPGAYVCMLTSFLEAAQQLQQHIWLAEVGFHIWCRFAQGGDLEDWLVRARESVRIDFPRRAHECMPYTPPQQAQVISMIRDLFQVCSAASPCDLLMSACCRCSILILSCSLEEGIVHLARLQVHDCSC